jgi:hypothetical protein
MKFRYSTSLLVVAEFGALSTALTTVPAITNDLSHAKVFNQASLPFEKRNIENNEVTPRTAIIETRGRNVKNGQPRAPDSDGLSESDDSSFYSGLSDDTVEDALGRALKAAKKVKGKKAQEVRKIWRLKS